MAARAGARGGATTEAAQGRVRPRLHELDEPGNGRSADARDELRRARNSRRPGAIASLHRVQPPTTNVLVSPELVSAILFVAGVGLGGLLQYVLSRRIELALRMALDQRNTDYEN